MPIVRIPTPLRSYTQNLAEVKVEGGTVGDVLRGPRSVVACGRLSRRGDGRVECFLLFRSFHQTRIGMMTYV